jgi:molybdopterin converting factor subunit 1
MRVEVLYFAAARDAAGTPAATLEFPAGTSAERALALLVERHAGLAGLRPSLRLAVNEEFVAGAAVLRDGDRLALLPPVSGG